MKLRLLLTAFVVGSYGWLAIAMNSASTLITGEAAVNQFNNSDTAFVVSREAMYRLNNIEGWLPILAVVALAALWWSPVKKLWSEKINHE